MTGPVALPDDLKKYLIPAFERKIASITAIQVKQMASYTDAVVIIEGTSRRQVTSIAEHLVKSLKNINIKPLGREGIKEGEWALLDYGHVVIHIFEPEAKSFYDLEGLWADAPHIDLSQFDLLVDTGTEQD